MNYRSEARDGPAKTSHKRVSITHPPPGVLDIMHSQSRMTIDPRIPTVPGWNTSSFHRPGRHR